MLTKLRGRSRQPYNFSEPIKLNFDMMGEDLLSELVSTDAFQRLNYIRFLGGIDYLLVRSPNGSLGNIRYTRYQHSLGVARLALLFCNTLKIPEKERRLVTIAALLHDIGHAPLSHSLEPVFKEFFEIDHHLATENIISGRVPLGMNLYKTLKRNNIDIERLIAIIDGKEDSYYGFFSGPINFDTIEGILRTRSYKKSRPSLLGPEAIIDAAIRRSNDSDRNAVDEFWSYKNQIYRDVINSPNGALADYACQLHMRRHINTITRDDYFSTEAEMFKKMPELREFLKSQEFMRTIVMQLNQPINYSVRKFYIESNADFYSRDDVGRYKQSKVSHSLSFDDLYTANPHGLSKELF